MSFDPWAEQSNESLNLVYWDRGQKGAVRLEGNFAYYLCVDAKGLVLKSDYFDSMRPEIIGVLSFGASASKFVKRGHLTPLGQRFAFDRSNGLHIVNNQAYFDLNEHVKVIDRVAGRNIEFVVERSL